jgi:hypothetical protein
MKPRLFPPGCVGIVVNSWAIDSHPLAARTGWQAGAAPQAHTATQARGIAP